MKQTQPDAVAALKEQLQTLVLRELDLFRRTALNNLASADLRAEATQAIETILRSGAVRLPDGSRVNAIIPPLSLIGPILTIRRFSGQRYSMARLVEVGALTSAMTEFLKVC